MCYIVAMGIDDAIKFVQDHMTDGLALVIGSGLSAAEGMPGMASLAKHLTHFSSDLTGFDASLWDSIQAVLDDNEGLEAALIKHAPSATLEEWIIRKTCELLIAKERVVMAQALGGLQTLRLTSLLQKMLKPPAGIPIITTNYDRLVEVAAELAGFHVDTTTIGQYAGAFDHTRSCMASCRGILTRAKTTVLDHFPRAVVLKPHGSFDWYKVGADARRCSLDLDGERLIITPGLNKYKAGYNMPFDKHRDLANDWIDRSSRLLVVGYGFNDDHLQTHLLRRIREGTPTLILNRSLNTLTRRLADEAPMCICLSAVSAGKGVEVLTKGSKFEELGRDLWDLGTLTEELL